MIPAKIMMEMPLPIPFSLISSASQTMNMVPAAMVMIMARVGKACSPLKPMPAVPANPPWL